MVSRICRASLMAGAAAVMALGLAAAAGAAEPVSFKTDVMPSLQIRCLECHKPGGDGYVQSGLDITSYAGLMKGTKPGELKAYGSGLLSSYGELAHCIDAPEVQRYPFQLEWVVNQYFEIDHYQPLLFVVDSFEHLFGEVEHLVEWVRAGKLDNVSPGEPAISEADLASFLHVSV